MRAWPILDRESASTDGESTAQRAGPQIIALFAERRWWGGDGIEEAEVPLLSDRLSCGVGPDVRDRRGAAVSPPDRFDQRSTSRSGARCCGALAHAVWVASRVSAHGTRSPTADPGHLRRRERPASTGLSRWWRDPCSHLPTRACWTARYGRRCRAVGQRPGCSGAGCTHAPRRPPPVWSWARPLVALDELGVVLLSSSRNSPCVCGWCPAGRGVGGVAEVGRHSGRAPPWRGVTAAMLSPRRPLVVVWRRPSCTAPGSRVGVRSTSASTASAQPCPAHGRRRSWRRRPYTSRC